jgi:hypothetical protein
MSGAQTLISNEAFAVDWQLAASCFFTNGPAAVDSLNQSRPTNVRELLITVEKLLESGRGPH